MPLQKLPALGCSAFSGLGYLLLSILVQTLYVGAFVWMGQSLAQSHLGRLLLAVGMLVGLALAVALVRQRFGLKGPLTKQP